MLTLALSWAAGASVVLAAGVAVWSSVVTLIAIELLIGLRMKAGARGLLLEGGIGVLLGVAVLGLRVLLH